MCVCGSNADSRDCLVNQLTLLIKSQTAQRPCGQLLRNDTYILPLAPPHTHTFVYVP